MFTVYVLISLRDGKSYIGHTSNIDLRIKQHNAGLSQYTKNRGPWRLVYTEPFDNRSAAMKREKFLKTGAGREYLDSVIGSV